MLDIGPLEVGEIKAVSFNFESEAGEGAVLNTPVVTVALVVGTDASPATVLYGSPAISGVRVTQLVRPGVVGCTYILRAHVKDATTQEHNIPCRLRVVPA